MSKKNTNEVNNVNENETSEMEAAVDPKETGAETDPKEGAAPEKKKLGKWAKIAIGAGIAAVTVIVGTLIGKGKSDDADDLDDGDDFDLDGDPDSDGDSDEA